MLPFVRKIRITKQVLNDLVPVALYGAANIFFFSLGIRMTTANATAILYTTTPLLVAIIAHKTIQENVSSQKAIGILLGFIGVLMIAFAPPLHAGRLVEGDVLGNTLIAAGVLMWSLFAIRSRFVISKGYTPLTITYIFFITTTIIFLVLSMPYMNQVQLAFLNINYLFLFFYFGIAVTVVTYVLQQWVVQQTSATTASLTNYIQVISAIILNAIFLHEKVTLLFIVASIFVVFGVFMATNAQTMHLGRQVLSKFKKHA